MEPQFRQVYKKLKRYVSQRSFQSWPSDPHDLEQEIWLNLWRVLESNAYDPERGSSYLFKVIENAIKMYRGRKYTKKRKPYVRTEEGSVMVSEYSIESLEESGEELSFEEPSDGLEALIPMCADSAHAKALLFRSMNPLQRRIAACWLNPPPELQLVSRNLGHKMKRIYVARYLGISKHQVLEALQALRDILKEVDLDIL